ncbi:hypothetical protein FNA67_02900 [Youhaiella tibetensis]|uniref:Uncharacterized protein n=1 Tax=Paradevosia tibetensis TaxID=1447062 RepID=A0A5B9DJA2_9HYPH|nr:hypothetical protein [Youhaiella tibetensis]QEE19183.1 hypothetical protein FNA67_02900 [Youhaiella tibetensis]
MAFLVPAVPAFSMLLALIIGLPVAIAGVLAGIRSYNTGRRANDRLPYILGLLGTVVSVIAAARVVLPFM